MKNSVNVSMSSLMSRAVITVRVTGLRRWKWRVDLGAWIVRFGARVIGCKCSVSLEHE